MLKVISVIHSALRTALLLVLTGLMGFGGYTGYQIFHAKELAERELQESRAEKELAERELQESRAEVDRLHQEIAAQERKIQRLETAIQLLKVDHRIAHIEVVDQWQPAGAEHPVTKFLFVEVNEQGQWIDTARTFTIEGDVVYIDSWVAKFQDEFVEGGDQTDPLRSTSICLFRRIFGEFQEPNEGELLDPIGSRPAAYSPGSEMTDLERDIWQSFWEYANDPAKAEAVGLRAAHGEAPSIQLRKGKRYKIFLRASDGLSIVPENLPPSGDQPPI